MNKAKDDKIFIIKEFIIIATMNPTDFAHWVYRRNEKIFKDFPIGDFFYALHIWTQRKNEFIVADFPRRKAGIARWVHIREAGIVRWVIVALRRGKSPTGKSPTREMLAFPGTDKRSLRTFFMFPMKQTYTEILYIRRWTKPVCFNFSILRAVPKRLKDGGIFK